MIELKPFNKDDFQTLISWIKSEKDLIQFAGLVFSYPLTNNQLHKYVNDLNRKVFKIVDSVNGLTIGHSEIYFKDNSAKLCRILIGNIKYRGKGICEKIIQKLVDISFENINIKKVELSVFDWNIPAIKCYKKVGFQFDRENIKTAKIKNEIWTAINMKIERDKISNE